jgi:polyferredoxin
LTTNRIEPKADSNATAAATRIAVKVAPVRTAASSAPGFRIDLFKWMPGLRRLVGMRSFQFLVIVPNLFFFAIFILAGFIGSPVGNRNVIIVFIWILWWFLLIALMVPFMSRIWCTVCPLPFFGDWVQRRALVGVRSGKTFGLNNVMYGLSKRWPRKLSNIWLQNIGFLALCTFSAILVTRPVVTSGVLLGLMVVALGLGAAYRLRTFCNYICPVSGFLSLYSMASMAELRSRDLDECQKCRSKACRTGGENGWACPWMVYMGKLDRNNYCGLCMECVKSCPNDNIALNVRPFCSDTRIKGYDEAWKGFIMLALAMAYSMILLGPSGTIKDWANVTESGQWAGFAGYTAILWGGALVAMPALFYACVRVALRLAGNAQVKLKEAFLGFSYILVPLGLLAWIAFSFPLIFVNGSYILTTMSDPFGWGWDLFGTANIAWRPLIPEYLGYIQLLLLGIGLYYALKRGGEIAERLFGPTRATWALLPIGGFATAVTLAFAKVFLG